MRTFAHFYIPRSEMPQIDEANLPQLIAVAFDSKLNPAIDVVNPDTLHAHQKVSHKRALAMPETIKLKPVLVSSDNYILDGNHRWWAHVHSGDKAMPIIRLGLTFHAAIDWLFAQPFTYKLTPTTAERN